MRFFDNATLHNENVYRLYQMFGPNTKVSVDYYSSHMWGGHDLLRDFVQREGNNLRWAFNGMKPDDVAVVGDTDETFTRLVHFFTCDYLFGVYRQMFMYALY
jgi:hypothetical protein